MAARSNMPFSCALGPRFESRHRRRFFNKLKECVLCRALDVLGSEPCLCMVSKKNCMVYVNATHISCDVKSIVALHVQPSKMCYKGIRCCNLCHVVIIVIVLLF